MRWLIDGYNVVRRDPDLADAEQAGGLESGRLALCRLLADAARISGDEFTVVFDGASRGGAGSGGAGVRIVFSSARETADQVIARLSRDGGAVVSNDREVQRGARKAGAVAVSADEFLSRLDRSIAGHQADAGWREKEEKEDAVTGPRKGNPRRLGKKARARARALGRLGPG